VLAKKLFYGGSYFSTAVAIDKYTGPSLSAMECLAISVEFISQFITNALDELRLFILYGFKWSDWFLADYLADSFFVLHPTTGTLTIILSRDTD